MKTATMKRFAKIVLGLFVALNVISCSSEQGDLIDLELNTPDRKPIDQSKVGVNNFFNQPQFGSIPGQFAEIRNTLGVRFVRVLFAWTDDMQPSLNAIPNNSFNDAIVDAIPGGVDVVVVLAHTPSWMANSANWTDGDPRKTWVEEFLKPTVRRYAGRSNIIGWEVWNEPDLTVVASDTALGLTAPENYVELLRMGAAVIRAEDPNALVLNAATSSIQQNFPVTLKYNERLRDLGAIDLVDVFNVHYYGKQYENLIRGVEDLLNGISKPIWITESGQQGPTEQLAYAEQTWPFLIERIPNIQRIYYFEFASTAPAPSNFGLKTTDPAFPVSDLYINLRDN